MRALTRSYSAPRERDNSEDRPLLFRSVALLYPWKEVLERIRRDSSVDAPLPLSIPPMFDEDKARHSPLAEEEDIRVMIAQDDAGVSLNRLLFDSKPANESKSFTATSFDTSSFSRPASHTQSLRATTSNGHHSSHSHADLKHATVPNSLSPVFGQQSRFRRMPAYVSLADSRNDPQLPIQDSKDEMDSWLDCIFGKSQMRYKGENTKLHILQRQPVDLKPSSWDKEPQRRQSLQEPTLTHLPRSRSDELKLRKSALLISRTFTVPIQSNGSNPNRKASHKVCYSTPTFGVAVMLPLAKSLDEDGNDASTSQIQPAIDNWHVIVRALDSLEASAALHIQQKLKEEVEVIARRYANAPPTTLRMPRLKPGALQELASIHHLSEFVSTRIERAFCVIQVSARNEWNIWRDELRELTKSTKASDATRVAFVNLALTTALSSNLSWMRIFAPPHLQSRLQRESRAMGHRYGEAQNRIVIVTADHNKARQIIYLMSKFMPISQPLPQFLRSPTTPRPTAQVSALTQGLKAAGQTLDNPRMDHWATGAPAVAINAPVFSLPMRSSPSTSPVKQALSIDSRKSASPSYGSLQRMKSRIDVQQKCSPAMPIASAPGSSYTTPAASPDARMGSSVGAQGDLLRHLQRDNSALSETSTESGSFWNSLRSTSWNWGFRRESGATNTSGSDGGAGTSQRGDTPASILKTGKTSVGRNYNKKLVRMVEEAEELHVPFGEHNGRKDSGIQASTLQPSGPNKTTPAAFAQVLEYTYDAAESVVDVELLGKEPRRKSCKVPASRDCFPLRRNKQNLACDLLLNNPASGRASYDRVAGYLERLHPDFALQAVTPYGSLEDDLKLSMKGERSPKQAFTIADTQSFPLDRWLDVCTAATIDADTMSAKRLTLRRRVRYSVTVVDERHPAAANEASHSAIKITKSDEMDSVKRTYRRNDAGSKIDWKDKRVVSSESGGSSGSGENSLASSIEQLKANPPGSVPRRQPATSGPVSTDHATGKAASDSADPSGLPEKRTRQKTPIGDDLTAFIDEKSRNNNKAKAQPAVAAAVTRRVPKRNAEGKITGWKEVDDDEADEAGLHDLPAGFVNQKRERLMPAIHEQTLEEVFDEEVITKPEPAIANLLEQMLTTGEPRSVAPSYAGSNQERTHSRTNSRSNSICGSGLTELQHETKKIVEDVLEGLVTSVASEEHTPARPLTGGFFGFRLAAPATPETSVLRQSISKVVG